MLFVVIDAIRSSKAASDRARRGKLLQLVGLTILSDTLAHKVSFPKATSASILGNQAAPFLDITHKWNFHYLLRLLEKSVHKF